MSVSLKDVAAAAGVSPSTVSRAFSDNGLCKPRTRKRILKIASKMGYSQSPIAQSLTTNATRLVGVVVDNFQNPFFMDVFDALTAELQTAGYGCLIVNLSVDAEPEAAADMIMNYNVDGVIIASSTLPLPFVEAVRIRDCPIVHAFGSISTTSRTSVVGIDNKECGRLAARSIAAASKRKVALIGGPKNASGTADRVEGTERECQKLGLKIVSSVYADQYSYRSGAIAMAQILDQEETPDAIFCGVDLICMGAIDAARSRDFRIPTDLSFIGVNDMPQADWDSYKITTLRQPIDQVVESSIELLMQMINQGGRSL